MTRWRQLMLRTLGTGALLAAGVLVLVPTTSGAEQPSVVAWWYRDVPLSGRVQGQSAGTPVIAQLASSPAQVPTVPVTTIPPVAVTIPPNVTIPDPGTNIPTPNPGVPKDGLYVANDPTGVSAMSALRFDLADAAGGTLRLTIAPGSTPSSSIIACPSLSDWQPGGDQAWSRRPAHDCARLAITSSISADGTTMSWNLPGSFRAPSSDFFDVILMPQGGDGTPFQTTFVKPGDGAFEVTSVLSGGGDLGSDGIPADAVPGTFPSDTFYDSGSGVYVPGTEGTTGVPIELTANQRSTRGSGIGALAGVLENPTTRRMAALMLIVLGGYAYRQSGQVMQRAPMLLGSLGGSGSTPVMALASVSPPRGIGRFERARKVPPQRL